MGAEEKGLMDVWCRAWFEKEGEGGEEVGGRGQEGYCGGKRGWGHLCGGGWRGAGVSFSGLMRKCLYILTYIKLSACPQEKGLFVYRPLLLSVRFT